MIQKILIFNENGETRIVRTFEETYSNKEIKEAVLGEKDSNIIGDIVFRKFNTVYICFVVKDENEMYVLGLINMFVESLNDQFPEFSELHFVYQFNEIYDLVDKVFVGGYVIQ